MMNEIANEAYKAYKREWNRKNKEKIRQAQERYWMRKAEQMRVAQAEATGQV